MTKLKQHPINAQMPRAGADDKTNIRESIRKSGARYFKHHPIVMFEGMVLNGWERYEAALAEGVEPVFSEFVGDDPVDYVLAADVARRHLSRVQIINIYDSRFRDKLTTAARDRQRTKASDAPKGGGNGSVDQQIADKIEQTTGVAVSGEMVRANKVVNEQGTPELVAAKDAGQVSTFDAAAVASALTPAKQNQALAKVEAGEAPTLRKAAGKALSRKKKKAGKVTTDDVKITEDFGRLLRAFDDRAEAKQHTKRPEYKEVVEAGELLTKAWQRWLKVS